MIVTADAGTEVYNHQLGRMMALSFPVIAIPAMLFLLGIVTYFFRSLSKLTKSSLDQLLHSK